jgi:hypothetical protein
MKPELARVMLRRALDAFRDAGMSAARVTADELYAGDREVRMWLEEREQPFVLAVKTSEPLLYTGVKGRAQPHADMVARLLPGRAWRVLSAGAGSKGRREYRGECRAHVRWRQYFSDERAVPRDDPSAARD